MLTLLALFPSALNLPQTNPAETLEYAPVPPEDQDDITPPAGNFSSLGLGSSSSLSGDADGPGGPGGFGGETPGGRAVKSAGTKRCVGNPPRQTEDPLSPPCVASFNGDNGGATYQGVTRDEVRVLFAYGGGETLIAGSRNAQDRNPNNRYYDLGRPPEGNEDDEPLGVRALRTWQRYFNERYQTYGRFVHFWVYYGPGPGVTTEQSRSMAIENYERIKPFAVFPQCCMDRDAYQQVMTSKGVVAFNNLSFVPEATFRKFAPLYWNYSPSVEFRAKTFVSYVCSKVVGLPVSDSGNPGENGQPRKLGLIHNGSSTNPSFLLFRDLVRSGIESCGGKFEAVGTYPCDCLTRTDPSYAPPVMADFRDKGITTVIWAGGGEPNFSKAAKAAAYFPEWVIAGTSASIVAGHEGTVNGQGQDQDVWDHAWVVTALPLVETSGVTKACEQAWAEADGHENPLERNNSCMSQYDGLRQMTTGIQVSGPELNPRNLEKGYRAIPPKNSPRPDLPACYYEPADYTCVKDATVMWWDSTAQGSLGRGCWRMSENGLRYRPGSWPSGNIDAQRQPNNVCNNYTGGGAVG